MSTTDKLNGFGPLAGVKVVELCEWVAAPAAVRCLSEMGATVIKTEPLHGDAQRTQGPGFGCEKNDYEDPTFDLNNTNKDLVAINLKDEDELVGMVQVDPDDKDDIILITRLGTALRFRLDTVSCTGRATAGVRGMDVGKDDEVRWFEIPKAGDMLFVLSDRGFGKRMLSDDVERQGRAGKGQKLLPMNKTGETGTQVAVCLNVTGAKSVRVEQKHGHTVLLNMDEIAVERRASKGQLLVNVLLDDVVQYGALTAETKDEK